jgi:hypothetical protein
MPPYSTSAPSSLRVIRGDPPPFTLNDNNFGEALPYLLRDSGNRCAYSTVHKDDTAPGEMHVEHFDSRKVDGKRNHNYDNLLAALGACNRAKGYKWPSQEQQRLGGRFLDPSREHDYGVHLFEHADSHKIVATTAAGQFHLRFTGLNSDYLVKKRCSRARAQRLRLQPGLLELIPGQPRDDWECLIRDAENAVLAIPYLPANTIVF